MAAERRGQAPLTVSLPNDPSSAPVPDLPPISALFLIRFDLKAGYTISWKRSSPGIELDGSVEYKSLPSGLHTVQSDLIYFVHGEYAGLSAFVNAPDNEENRNAQMIAVGVLVPLSFGRLGRSWKHAEGLEELAQELVQDSLQIGPLEKYWELNKARSPQPLHAESPAETTGGQSQGIQFKAPRKQNGSKRHHSRHRSISDGSALAGGHSLSAHHPAWSLTKLIRSFGPLIFPVYRAALLRKRILISCHAPIQQVCDFVYNLSVLSNIPLAVTTLVHANSPPHRLRPLFSIGVHDIPLLEDHNPSLNKHTHSPSQDTSEEQEHGWIACTTDGILGMKKDLYDILITLPNKVSSESWPTITSSKNNTPILATQRDLRRYKALLWGLNRTENTITPTSSNPTLNRRVSTGSHTSLAPPSRSHQISQAPLYSIPETDSIIEPISWSALAYTGFMWWASAGERQIAIDDEFSSDCNLLDDLATAPTTPTPTTPKSRAGSRAYASGVLGDAGNEGGQARKETAIIAYFHRLTTLILTTLSDLADSAESDDERPANGLQESEEDERHLLGPAVYARSSDMDKMGLDSWSLNDHEFVQAMCEAYFGRNAIIEKNAVDVCGIRIC